MVVTVDRFIAIVYPFRYEQHVTAKSTLIAIASVWIFSELYSISVHVIYPPSKKWKKMKFAILSSMKRDRKVDVKKQWLSISHEPTIAIYN